MSFTLDRLTLNGWPPLASHMACLLLGMSLAHLSRGGAPPRLALAPRSVAIALPRGVLDPKLERGAKVHLVQSRAKDGSAEIRCRLAETAWTVLDPGSVAVSTAPSTRDLAAAVRAFKDRSLNADDATDSARLPLCRQAAKVTYGLD